MKVISVVIVTFLTACAVSGNPLGQPKESRDSHGFDQLKRAAPENYESVGCYSFKKLKRMRIFSKAAYNKVTASSGTPINQCIQMGSDNNYEIIGIQKIGKNIFCWKGNEKLFKPDAAIPKLHPKKCKANVGSRKSIFVYRQSLATCSAKGKTYNDGDTIVFHNVTYPIDQALCTSCMCSAGDITDCDSYFCDIGLVGALPEVCDNWITGEEGVCCPRCECSNNGDTWVKHVSSGDCYECSCQGSTVHCSAVLCTTGCPGITVPVPGKCCPKCVPTTPNPATGFTILLTTTRAPPSFPFPFKRDIISLDEQLDGVKQDDAEQ